MLSPPICRVCLLDGKDLYNVANSRFGELYEKLTNAKLQKHGQPSSVCSVCLSALRRCLKFVEIAKESNNMLDQWCRNQDDVKLTKRPLVSLIKTITEYVEITTKGIQGPAAVKQEGEGADETENKGFVHNGMVDRLKFEYESDNEICNDNPHSSYNNENATHISDDLENVQTLKADDYDRAEDKLMGEADKKQENTSKKPFQCNKCDFKTRLKGHLNRHLTVHNGGKRLACNACNFTTNRKETLKQHLAIHIGKKDIACDQCNFTTNRKFCLIQHLKIHTVKKPYACEKCNFETNRKGNLKRHEVGHTGEKLFVCHKCGYRTTRKTILQTHLIDYHSGEKPFACNQCKYKTSRKDLLKNHIVTHTRAKLKTEK